VKLATVAFFRSGRFAAIDGSDLAMAFFGLVICALLLWAVTGVILVLWRRTLKGLKEFLREGVEHGFREALRKRLSQRPWSPLDRPELWGKGIDWSSKPEPRLIPTKSGARMEEESAQTAGDDLAEVDRRISAAMDSEQGESSR